MSPNESKILLSTSLKTYFYDSLIILNKESICPMPESVLYYSAEVLDRLSLSQDFFEVNEGRVREKILGLKLLESSNYPHAEQVRIIRDVADTSLLVSGYFSDSIKGKIVDSDYYVNVGRNAYSRLNNLSPQYLDIPSFYSLMATCFDRVGLLLKKISIENFKSQEIRIYNQFEILNKKVS